MSFIKCESEIVLADVNSASCASGFIDSQPDYDTLLNQLAALNEFDPEKTAWIIIICLSTFIVGFGTGVVIKLLRRL